MDQDLVLECLSFPFWLDSILGRIFIFLQLINAFVLHFIFLKDKEPGKVCSHNF